MSIILSFIFNIKNFFNFYNINKIINKKSTTYLIKRNNPRYIYQDEVNLLEVCVNFIMDIMLKINLSLFTCKNQSIEAF